MVPTLKTAHHGRKRMFNRGFAVEVGGKKNGGGRKGKIHSINIDLEGELKERPGEGSEKAEKKTVKRNAFERNRARAGADHRATERTKRRSIA